MSLDSIRSILHHRLMIPFYVPSLLFAFAYGLLIPVLPLYAGTFNVSYALIGLVLAGNGLGLILGDVPAGVLLRRFGTKRTMILGLGINALTVLALFGAGSILLVVALRIVAGFTMASYNLARHAYLAESVVVTRRGRAIAIYGGVFRIGLFAGPAVGGILGTLLGLRAPFVLYALVSAVAAILIVLFMHVDESVADNFLQPESRGGMLLATFKEHYRILLTAGAGQLFAQMIREGRSAIIPLYAADVLGLAPDSIGIIVSLASALDMMMFYPAGWVMDNLGRKYAIVPSFVVQAVGMALVPFTTSGLGLLAATSVMTFANGLSSGTMMTLGSDLAPPSARGEFLGMWRLVGDGGVVGGPAIVGGIADLLTLPAAALVLSGAGLTAALIFSFFVPETLKRKPKPAGT